MKKLLVFLTMLSLIVGCNLKKGSSSGTTSSDGNVSGHYQETPMYYIVSATVSGLSGTLMLQNQGASPFLVMSNGRVDLLSHVPANATYDIRIVTMPAMQTCTIEHGAGTISGNVSNVSIVCTWNRYKVGGTVRGLVQGSFVLQNRGEDDLDIRSNGAFVFATDLLVNSSYEVTVKASPVGQTCSVSNGSGTVEGTVSTVEIECVPNRYRVGGTVSGLKGNIRLHLNDENLTLSQNGTFAFANSIPFASSYAASIQAMPEGQLCSIENASGTMPDADVSAIKVMCKSTEIRLPMSVTGLSSGESIILETFNGRQETVEEGTTSVAMNLGDVYHWMMVKALSAKTCHMEHARGRMSDTPTAVSIACERRQACAPSSLELWRVDGEVKQTLCANDRLVLGGAFMGLGPVTGAGISVALTGEFPRVLDRIENGDVLASIPDGLGGWFIAGTFTRIAGVERAYLAHILSNHALDDRWSPNVNGPVKSLLVQGDRLYIGGSFTSVNGQKHERLARLVTATASVDSWAPTIANGSVYTMAWTNAILYVGGDFTSVGTTTRNRLAAWDMNGMLQAWNPNADGVVRRLALKDNRLYLAGEFLTVKGDVRRRLAAVTTDGVLSAWNPDANFTVRDLIVDGDLVYVGGSFTEAGGTKRNRLAALDATTGKATNWNPDANSDVYVIAQNASTVFAGGAFSTVNNVERRKFVAVLKDKGTVSALAPNPNHFVLSVSVSNDRVYVGGRFSSLATVTRHRLAEVDLATGQATNWNPDADGAIEAMVQNDSTLVVGGHFTQIGKLKRNHVAALSLSNGIATDWTIDVNGTVNALAVAGSTVYMGGEFNGAKSVGKEMRNRLAAVDLLSGVVTNWDPNASDSVTSLLLDGKTIYVGGYFTSLGRMSRAHTAAIQTDGTVLPWDVNANNVVMSLAKWGESIALGGSFTNVNGETRERVALVDSGTGALQSWNVSVNGTVNALVANGESLIMGGAFTNVNSAERGYMARLTSEGKIDEWNPNMNSSVTSLVRYGNTLYGGGVFSSMNGEAFNGAQYWTNMEMPVSTP